ncbi:MAG: IS5 family transposase [Myxacorys chilensis ATA2-1-KO14]|jgi:putative transposase|nr:IS5 family transposase [Myxacorys chilensis ATA2-1-KO14]
MTLAYPTELRVEQYELFQSLLLPAAKAGRPRSVNLMLVVQAILYVLVSGGAWRLLPHEYPPYSTVYYYFRQWRTDGSWKRIHDQLVQWVRVGEDRLPSPSAASLDSQTVASAVMVHQDVDYDAGKKTKGRKRFTLVDTLGLLIAVKVVAANTQSGKVQSNCSLRLSKSVPACLACCESGSMVALVML